MSVKAIILLVALTMGSLMANFVRLKKKIN